MRPRGYLATALVSCLMILAYIVYLPVFGVSSPSPGSLSPWGSTTNYSSSVYGESCVTSLGYVYCVGGFTDAVYYARMNAAGITGTSTTSVTYSSTTSSTVTYTIWITTTNYPISVGWHSCVGSSGYVYCIAGKTSTGAFTNAVYYAPISSKGVGDWHVATSYPLYTALQSCVPDSGYIYCVGGTSTNAVYFAPIKSDGSLGNWTSTTSYPTSISKQSCVTNSGYIYCIGGSSAGGAPITSVSYASISSSGVGAWQTTTSYPTFIQSQSCVAISQYVYCVGGQTSQTPAKTTATAYYAPISSSGIGAWTNTTSYPLPISYESCVASFTSYVYCIAGLDWSGAPTSGVYYTLAVLPATVTSTVTTTSTVTSTSQTANQTSLTTLTFSRNGAVNLTSIGGYKGLLVRYANNYYRPLQAIVFAVIQNSQNQTVGFSTASVTIGSSDSASVFVVLPLGLAHGTYAVYIFAVTTGNIPISTVSTINVTV